MMFGKRKPHRLRRREETGVWKKIFIWGGTLCVFAGVLYGVWYVTHLPRFLISDIEVTGVETIPASELASRAESVLGGSYLGIIPHRFIYFYPKNSIAEAFASIPRIKTTVIQRRDTTTLSIVVTEQAPVALWCAEIENASTTPECFFINDDGIAYDKAPSLIGSTFLRYTVEESAPERGRELLNEVQRNYLVTFVNELQKQYGLGVSRITITADTDAFLYLSSGARIMVGMADDVAEVYANLATIFESKDFKHLVSGTFEYIDLRFGRKIFVQVESPVASTTEALNVATST